MCHDVASAPALANVGKNKTKGKDTNGREKWHRFGNKRAKWRTGNGLKTPMSTCYGRPRVDGFLLGFFVACADQDALLKPETV